jgi:esterase/lipase
MLTLLSIFLFSPFSNPIAAEDSSPCHAEDLDRSLPVFSVNEIREGAEQTFWVKPNQKPKAVALVVHGLNVKPSAMNAIVSELVQGDILILRLTLTGHGDESKDLFKIQREDWLNDLLMGYCLVKNKSMEYNIPVLFTGFSLGCVVALDLMGQDERVRFDRLVLFAPALTPKLPPYFIKIGNLFGKHRIVQSRTPASYRVHDGIPLNAYNTLFEHARNLRLSRYKGLNTPALIFIDPRDEFISKRELQRLIEEKHLDRWNIITVEKENFPPGTYHHLIITPGEVGNTQWIYMSARMFSFLDFH